MAEGDLVMLKGPNGYYYVAREGAPGRPGRDAENLDVDSALNSSSTNPVQNKVIWSALSSKAGLSNGKVVSSQLPVAGSGSASKGVVYAGDRGIGVLSNGGLYIQSATSEQIASRVGAYNPIWASQINLVVKAALTDSNHITLLSAEQATARGIFGAVGENHSHAISNVSGLQDALTGLVAHVDSFAEVSAEWISNPAIRGREKVYICRGENTTDLDEMLKGHIYHLQLFPETYEYTYEYTQWEAEWSPTTGWFGHWEETTETALRLSTLDLLPDAVPRDYFLRNDKHVSENGEYALYVSNQSWFVYDTSISDIASLIASSGMNPPPEGVYDLQYTPSETEVCTGVDWVSNGAVVWHAHTVTKTATGFTIDYLWQDITPIGNSNDPDHSTSQVYELTGESGVVSPGEVYRLAMSANFTLSASTETDYGEAVVFVTPGEYTFSVASGITLSATMTSGNRYRLLVSWTPYGVVVEQTAEWEVPSA